MNRTHAFTILRKAADPYRRIEHTALEAADIALEHHEAEQSRRANITLNLMWMALIGVIAMCAMCCTPSKPTPAKPETHTSNPRSIDEQDESAVRIENACVDGDAFAGTRALNVSGGVGSGVIISTGRVLTAAHVVKCDGAQILKVVRKNGVKYTATIAFVDESRDYARLKVQGLAAVSSVIVTRAVAGEEVCIASAHPYRGRACGLVSNIEWKKVENGIVDLWTSIRTVPGNSGSAIYNAKGELVGLATNLQPCIVDAWRDDCGGLGTSLAGRMK